jgi:hypothetical protein
MMEYGSKNFFQDDLKDHEFDCCVVPLPGAEPAAPRSKTKVLVGAARKPGVQELKSAAQRAGLALVEITLSQVGQAAAASALLGVAEFEAVATLDVGFSHSSICILSGGDIVHSRVVTLGGDKLTRGLSEAMNVSYAAAEGVKLVLPDKVGATLKELLSALASELNASIDFFEVECGKKVGCVFVSGGSARSSLIVQMLQELVDVPIKQWNLNGSMTLAVPETQIKDLQRELPQLTVAVGGGLNWLESGPLRINFLAKEQEAEAERKRDPMRPCLRVAGFLLALMMVWSLCLIVEQFLARTELKGQQARMSSIQKSVDEVAEDARIVGEIQHRILTLSEHTTNRFLWAVQLNELQQTIVDDIALTRLTMESTFSNAVPVLNPPKDRPPNPADRQRTIESVVMNIQAKDFASPGATEKFIEMLSMHPYFEKHFRNASPIALKNRVSRQIDPADPSRSFALITLECIYRDRIIGYE